MSKAAEQSGLSIDSHEWLRVRQKLAENLHAQGFIKQAKVVVEVGIKDAQEARSKTFEARFRALRMQCSLHVKDISSKTWDEELSEFHKLLNDERKHLSQLDLSKLWEIFGDVLSDFRPNNVEAICLAYDMAEESLNRYLDSKTGKRIPLPSYSQYLPRSCMCKYKRAQALNSLGNYSAAHDSLIDALHVAGRTPHCIMPYLIMPLALLLAETKFKECFYQGSELAGDKNDALKRAYASVVLAEVSCKGANTTVLYTGLRGILAIAIEERDIDTVRDATVAAGNAAGARLQFLAKKFDNVFGKDAIAAQFSSFELPPSIGRQMQILNILQTNGDRDEEILKPPENLDELASFTRKEVKVTPKDLMHSIMYIRTKRPSLYNLPTDPLRYYIPVRVRTNYEAIIRIMGSAVDSLVTSYMPAKVVELIPDAHLYISRPGSSKRFSSTPKSETAFCVQWINAQLSQVNYMGSPDCVPEHSWILIICFPFTEASKKKASVVSKQGSSKQLDGSSPHSSKPSSAKLTKSKSGSKGSLTSLDTLPPLKVHTTQMTSMDMENITLYARAALLNLKKFEVTNDPAFMEESQKAYTEMMEMMKRALGGVDLTLEETAPPPLSSQVLEIMRNVFNTEMGYFGQPADNIVFDWFGRIAAAVQYKRV
ncbi:hypothetical protein HDV05_007869 [Chytridiales sp. JEL 0842]|nr:hypothetical protein HDV05_007869 [Chytridiales sp. JEL 0842]